MCIHACCTYMYDTYRERKGRYYMCVYIFIHSRWRIAQRARFPPVTSFLFFLQKTTGPYAGKWCVNIEGPKVASQNKLLFSEPNLAAAMAKVHVVK